MNPPKIVIIGAGSLFFGRQAIWALNHQPGFRGATLALVDIDAQRLEKMRRLAVLAAESSGSGVQVEASTDYREALKGADFVVLSFSKNNAQYRRIDCRIAAKYGVRMCSGDTIGPGGVFRTAREFPLILEIARTMETVCPEAWLINYVNPSAVMGIGLMRHARTKSFALCDTHHMPAKFESYANLLELQGEDREKFQATIAGVNHFTWMLGAEVDGRDVLPDIREAFRALGVAEKDQGHSKGRFNNFITAQLADLFGAIPTCTGHTKEYLPFYQGRASISEPIPPLAIFDSDEREKHTNEMWTEVEDYVEGRKPIQEFLDTGRADHATDVIHTMLVEDGRQYFINRPNSDCTEGGGSPVTNLPSDAFLELLCELDKNGPRPLPVGSFPLGLRAFQTLILDVHELTIEAIVKEDRSLLLRALAMDPLVNSIATAQELISEIYAAESEILPSWIADPGTAAEGTPAISPTGPAPQLF